MTTKTPSPKGNGKFLGRPTKYDPAICEKIIELGRQGKSKAQMVAATDIPYATLTRWCDEYPEFRAAMDHAMFLSQSYWEDLGHTHMVESPGGPRLNTGLWSRSMAARFPRDYRENAKVELVGKNDGPIEVDHIHDFSKTLLDDLLGIRQKDAQSKGR
jgi:transposase